MFNFDKINTLVDTFQKENKSLRVQDISNKVGISKTMFDKVRHGESKPTVEVLERIALYFGKDMNYFFDMPSSGMQEVTPEYILKRYEELVVENNKLKERVEALKGCKKYRVSSGSSLMAASPQAELERKNNPR